MPRGEPKPTTLRRASTLSDEQQARVRSLLEPLCTPHADPKVRAKLQYVYRFEGPAVVFFERRPHFETGEWFSRMVRGRA